MHGYYFLVREDNVFTSPCFLFYQLPLFCIINLRRRILNYFYFELLERALKELIRPVVSCLKY